MHKLNFYKQSTYLPEINEKKIDSFHLNIHNLPPSRKIYYYSNSYSVPNKKYILNKKIQKIIFDFENEIELGQINEEGFSTFLDTIKVVYKEIGKAVLVALIIFMFSRQFFQNYQVSGISMEPTFYNNDLIFVNKLVQKSIPMKWIPFLESERWHIRENIKAGDSVVFKYGIPNHEKFLVKRVAAVAGQTVEFQNGIVKVDGKIIQKLNIDNPYIKMTSEFKKMIVPERSIFVLGDNAYNSFDSRFWGFIKTYQVYGKTEFIYWPTDRIRKIEHSIQYDLGK